MGHHGKIVVKTDQESAIIDLLRTVAKGRGEARTVFETAARSDSKGNGEAEKAVQSIEEMLRTLMVDLEERCGEPLSVTEPFFEWLIEHACDLLNKYHVRKGNKTAWESIKKGPYTGDVYQFGAPVMHRLSGPVQGGVVHERWHDGVYLGTQFSSGEHIVAMPDGKVVRARAVQPKPEGVPTTKASLDVIASGPAGGSVVITQKSSGPTKKSEDGTPGSSDSDPVPTGFRVNQDLLDKVGYSKGSQSANLLEEEREVTQRTTAKIAGNA